MVISFVLARTAQHLVTVHGLSMTTQSNLDPMLITALVCLLGGTLLLIGTVL
jgi:hypothetical protein